MWRHLLTKFSSSEIPPVMVSTYGYVVPLAMFTTIIALSHHPNTRLTLVTLHQKVRIQSWLCLQIHCHLQAGFFKYLMVFTKSNEKERLYEVSILNIVLQSFWSMEYGRWNAESGSLRASGRRDSPLTLGRKSIHPSTRQMSQTLPRREMKWQNATYLAIYGHRAMCDQ